MARLPAPLAEVVDGLAKLPGFGPKSALKAAMMLLSWPAERTRGLGQAVASLRDRLFLCSRCGSFCETDPCPLCVDQAREEHVLCVVAEWDSLLALEEAAAYRGRYLVLGGLFSPLDGVDAASLNMDLLFARLGEGAVSEVVLALGATAEAEATASWIKNALAGRFPQVRVSRLAQGMPLGSEVKYMDRETLKTSMRFRQDL